MHEPMRGLERQSQQLHEFWWEKEESEIGLVSQREREQILREIAMVRKIGREGGNDIAREKKYSGASHNERTVE